MLTTAVPQVTMYCCRLLGAPAAASWHLSSAEMNIRRNASGHSCFIFQVPAGGLRNPKLLAAGVALRYFKRSCLSLARELEGM